MYCISNYPLTDGNYIQSGTAHTVLGMQYGDLMYGGQVSFGVNGIKYRTLYSGVWDLWRSVGRERKRVVLCRTEILIN